MEEDKKRIENLIERCKQCKLNACITCDICWSEVQAIEKLVEDNNNLKAAALKNDDLYKEVCNKNKELEEENEKLKKHFLCETFEPSIKITKKK